MPDLQLFQCQKILSFVRAGADPEVAALAVGLSLKEFRQAIRAAQRTTNPVPGNLNPCADAASLPGCPSGPGDMHLFAREVLETWATARIAADIRMFRERPADWLRCGPGKAYPLGNWSQPKSRISKGSKSPLSTHRAPQKSPR